MIDQNIYCYLPAGSETYIRILLQESPVLLRISKPRSTKLGDFRSPHKGKPAIISMNENLNPYSFLITLIHEIAHLRVWNKYGRKLPPHGEVWKHTYSELLAPLCTSTYMPNDIKSALVQFRDKPKAASHSDNKLYKVLKRYDPKSHHILLEQLEKGAIFKIGERRIFRKGEQLRKRFKCMEIKSGKTYLVSPTAEIEEIKSI